MHSNEGKRGHDTQRKGIEGSRKPFCSFSSVCFFFLLHTHLLVFFFLMTEMVFRIFFLSWFFIPRLRNAVWDKQQNVQGIGALLLLAGLELLVVVV